MTGFCCPECGTTWTSHSDALYCCNTYWKKRLAESETAEAKGRTS